MDYLTRIYEVLGDKHLEADQVLMEIRVHEFDIRQVSIWQTAARWLCEVAIFGTIGWLLMRGTIQ